MRGVLAALVVAVVLAVIAAGAFLLLRGVTARQVVITQTTPEPAPPPAEPPMEAVADAPKRPERRRTGRARQAFEPGTVTLTIGQAYRFGDDDVQRADGFEDADLICLDLRGTQATLRTPHGAAEIEMPFVLTGELPPLETLYGRIEAAPAELPRERVILGTNPDPRRSRVPALLAVRGADGSVRKLHMSGFSDDAAAWKRRVTLAYADVPATAERVRVPVPEAVVARPPTESVQARLDKVLVPPEIPGLKYTGFADGDHAEVPSVDEELTLSRRTDLVVREPLTTTINLRARGSLVLAGGTRPESHVNTFTYGAVIVDGTHEGEIETNSYGYVRITGDLTGKVSVRSYGTLVVDGALRGVVELQSYATLVALGDVPDPQRSIQVRARVQLYLNRYMAESDLVSIGPNAPRRTHVRLSDLAAGEHEIGEHRIIVADPLWTAIAR